MNGAPTHYRDHFALAELPYFEVADGRIKCVRDDLGNIVDVHTHLALSYGRRQRVDLWHKADRTQHYLPLERPLDFNVYSNRNFTPEDLGKMKRDLSVKSFTGKGMRTTHTVPNLTGEMADLGITHSVLLPIDFPWLSRNAETYLEIATQRDDLISLGSVHPSDKAMEEKLDQQQGMGARGIKFHPAVQMMRPDHPKAMQLYQLCAERDLPILWHGGPVGIEPKLGRYLSQMKHYWAAVRDNPNTTFVVGHSGALQWEMALELAKQYDNVYLEVSCQSIQGTRSVITEAPEDRIMFGSDWPFYHQAIPLAKVLLVTEDCPEKRPKVFWENAARVFRLEG